MPLPRPASPRALIADIRAFAAQRPKHQWIALFLALAMPLGILVVFTIDARTNINPGEQVIFAESWTANRTDDETEAAQVERQRERERAEAERRRQWQALGDRLGIDP